MGDPISSMPGISPEGMAAWVFDRAGLPTLDSIRRENFPARKSLGKAAGRHLGAPAEPGAPAPVRCVLAWPWLPLHVHPAASAAPGRRPVCARRALLPAEPVLAGERCGDAARVQVQLQLQPDAG